MLVTHFGKYASPSSGGMEMFLYTLCQGLTARGVACEVIVCQDNGHGAEFRELGVKVQCLRTFGAFHSLPLCPPAPFALRGCQADVVHLHHPNPLGDIAWLLARPSGRL